MRAKELRRESELEVYMSMGRRCILKRPYQMVGMGKRSGYGRFGGMAGMEEFTARKILSLGPLAIS